VGLLANKGGTARCLSSFGDWEFFCLFNNSPLPLGEGYGERKAKTKHDSPLPLGEVKGEGKARTERQLPSPSGRGLG